MDERVEVSLRPLDPCVSPGSLEKNRQTGIVDSAAGLFPPSSSIELSTFNRNSLVVVACSFVSVGVQPRVYYRSRETWLFPFVRSLGRDSRARNFQGFLDEHENEWDSRE